MGVSGSEQRVRSLFIPRITSNSFTSLMYADHETTGMSATMLANEILFTGLVGLRSTLD